MSKHKPKSRADASRSGRTFAEIFGAPRSQNAGGPTLGDARRRGGWAKVSDDQMRSQIRVFIQNDFAENNTRRIVSIRQKAAEEGREVVEADLPVPKSVSEELVDQVLKAMQDQCRVDSDPNLNSMIPSRN